MINYRASTLVGLPGRLKGVLLKGHPSFATRGSARKENHCHELRSACLAAG